MKYIIDKIDELETNSKAKNTIEYRGIDGFTKC